MARSRMIRPEFWDDEKLSKVSIIARLIFIGMWNHSDDYGVAKGNTLWLKNHILPYEDSLSTHDFLTALNELEGIKRIIKFNHGGEVFFYIRNFLKHQKVNRPSKQRNPAPPEDILTDGSVSTHGILTDETEFKQKQKQNKNIPEPENQKTKKFVPKKKDPSGLKSGTFKSKEKETDSFSFENISGIFQDIKSKCEELITLQITEPIKNADSFNPKLWVQAQLKTKKHPGAILKTLDGLVLYRIPSNVLSPWGYCENNIGKYNGNFNESDAIKIHQELKKMPKNELSILTSGLFEGMA